MGNKKAFPISLRGILAFFSVRLEGKNQGQSQSKTEMHHLIFGRSFAELVALVLLAGLAFYFLNKKKPSAHRDAKDVDISASDSVATPAETNFDGSNSSPTKNDNITSSSSPKETNNGASSSLIASIGNCYEVFLSFRGSDTRHSFTDHLYQGLSDAGIHTFRDEDKLCQGEEIGPDLWAAIKNSKILIPILSVNYGSSKWCLNELVQIMECKNGNKGQIVLPIFYKVEPTHVRHQYRNFEQAFNTGEKHFDRMIFKKWKQALIEVCSIKGLEAKGYEGVLVKSIVQRVLSKLKKDFESIIPDYLVGIDGHVKRVMKDVDNHSNATLFVGIHGMGGIGKTALAKTIYYKLSHQFMYRSFIADIRESSQRNGLKYLQNQLIFDISQQKIEVTNKDDGIKFISSTFHNKKVLILLDDVDDDDQLKALAGNHNWFSSGSRILITTRNISILDNVRVDYKYEHKEMDKDCSMVLFIRHAFRKSSPPSEFEDLARDVIDTTGGLPLSLEVLGSYLCGKKPEFWRSTIAKLKRFPHEKVREKLRISYEALDDGQKQIFLDIACFFIGADKRTPYYMWHARGFFPGEGIEVLRFMSLIKVGDDHKLRMHDQLRDLGRDIACEENRWQPQYRSRLWDSEEVQKVLKENKGTNKIEAIYLSKGSSEGYSKIAERDGDIYRAKQFKKLKNLRFLHLKGVHLSGDFKDSLKELKLLRWQKCPTNFEVNNFHVKELAVLELPRSEINEKWQGWSFFMMAEKLKYLDLSACNSLEGTEFLSAFKKLEVLILNGCGRLKRIDASIGEMEALLHLELRKCMNLTELPVEIGNLKALQQLNLEGTRSLSALPDSVGCLENLEILEISWSGIEELPNGIGSLRKLRELRAFSCINLKEIMAESMRNLSSLRHLDFLNCDKLQSLPDLPSGLTDLSITCQSRKVPSLSHLVHLKKLLVEDCGFIECIQVLPSTLLKNSECSQKTDVEELESPQSLNTPFKLEILQVMSCDSIETLDVSQFIHLRKLIVDYCRNLLEVQGLDKLIDLESLTVLSCGSIQRLDLPRFEVLKELDARCCNKLAEIQGLDRLEYLERLDIEWCTSIKRLDLPKSGRLKKLKAKGCENLAEIQGLDSSEYLERLGISRCTSIGRLLLPKSGRLKELDARECENLAEIRGLNGLEYLERLNIEGCTSMERLYLPKSRMLKKLQASGCKNLAEIQGLDRSEYLEMLDIEWCTSMERLDLPKSGRLKELDAGECENLAKIQGLDGLEYLEKLNIECCTLMERLYLPKSGRLKKLQASGCKKLAKIQGIDRSEYLEMLNIKLCTSMERLDLPKSGRLKELDARECEKLVKIQGLDGSEYLERLDIKGCTSMERLYLPKSGMLKKLQASGCKNLAEIQGLDRSEYLEMLDIEWCILMERLHLPKFGRLKKLNAGGCKNLAEIQGLDSLEYLESLDISRCTSIGRLDLPKSRSMKILYVNLCKNLAEIQGLNGLESLERLDISGCTSIKRLLLPKSNSLNILEARECENLVEIQGLDRLESLKELNITGCKLLKTIPELSGTLIYRYYKIVDRETMKYEWDYRDDSDEKHTEGSTFSNEGT